MKFSYIHLQWIMQQKKRHDKVQLTVQNLMKYCSTVDAMNKQYNREYAKKSIKYL